MAHQLSSRHEDLIERIIEIGDYADADQVIGEALRHLEEREQRLTRLRAAIAVGDAAIARGDVVDWTPTLHAEILREAKVAAKAEKKPKADVCP